MRVLHGTCLCRKVAYEVEDDFKYMGYCHCSVCRKFSGSALSAVGGVPKDGFRVVRGEDRLGRYEHSPSTIFVFCTSCGSSLYSDKPQRGMVHVRLGTLDEAPTRRPGYHIFVGSKATWDELADAALPRYDERQTT